MYHANGKFCNTCFIFVPRTAELENEDDIKMRNFIIYTDNVFYSSSIEEGIS